MTTGHRQWIRVAAAAHGLSLVGAFAVLLYCNRDQWFFGDEWDFLAHRGVFDAERSLWAAHTEHWSTLPILIYRSLYSLFGVRTYVPYAVVLLVLHLAVAHLLWRLLRTVGVDIALATALVAVYALLGAGYENLLWAFQIGFIGSVALGLGGLLLVNHDGPWDRRDVANWAVSVAGLLFSGVSVTMVAIAGLTVLMRRGLRDAALTVVVPGVVYAVWFVAYGRDNLTSDRGTFDNVFKYPDYIWTGLRSAFEHAVGFPGAGPVIVLALAAFLLRRGGRAAGPAAPAFACALGAIVIFALIALGRAGLGAQQSEASRYVYIVVALALPAIGLALHELCGLAGSGAGAEASLGRMGVVFVLLALVALHNGGVLRDQTRVEKAREQDIKAQILAAAELVSSPAVILGGNPEPEFSPDLVVDDLRRMARDGKLPPLRGVTAADRLVVAGILQYAVNERPLPAPTAPMVDGVVGATDLRNPAGCVRVLPTQPVAEVHLAGGAPMSLRVTTTVAGELTGYLRIFTPGVLTGPPHVDKVEAGVAVFVNVTADVDQVVLRVPASGATEVCGVR